METNLLLVAIGHGSNRKGLRCTGNGARIVGELLAWTRLTLPPRKRIYAILDGEYSLSAWISSPRCRYSPGDLLNRPYNLYCLCRLFTTRSTHWLERLRKQQQQ